MNTRTFERVALAVILLVYGVLAILFATQTPDWQIPDEPAHYNYVGQVAANGCCPVLEMGDWDADYLSELTSSGFDPQMLDNLPAVQYEDHQPPLYYLLAAPFYNLSGGDLLAVRLFSALLGAGIVLCVYGIGRAASGGSAILSLSAAGFAAFVPQHVAIMAGASNDALAELIVAAGVLLTLWYLTPDVPRRLTPKPWLLGLVMGLGFLTKASALLLGPVVMLAILLRWWREAGRRPADLLRAWALFLVPAVLLGLLWWGRNIGIYGWPDVLGLGRHDAVVVGQPRTADWIADKGFGGWFSEGVRVTFNSFWGQFGWMGVPMPNWVYTGLLLFTLGSYAGLMPLALLLRGEAAPSTRRDVLLTLAALYLLGILQFVYYNTAFVQFQGRYLYPAMSAFALAFAGGWTGWAWLAARGLRQPWLKWAAPAVMWAMAGLSGYALWQFVVPNLPAW